MANNVKRQLTADEINRLSSPYIKEGKHHDVWDIVDITVDDKLMIAHISMKSYYTSGTDQGGFHLTILSALEFLSQLMVIFVHVWAGYTEKTKEGWMLESSMAYRRAIRDPQNIEVQMKITSVRKVGESILITTKSQITDSDGLFEATMKGLLA